MRQILILLWISIFLFACSKAGSDANHSSSPNKTSTPKGLEAPAEDIGEGKTTDRNETTDKTDERVNEQEEVEVIVEETLEEEEKEYQEDEQLSIISYDNIETKGKGAPNISSANVPIKGHKVKLMIQNNHPINMWYLMPASGEKTMPIDGQFKANLMAKPPFLAKKYGGNNQYLVEVIYHGEIGHSFRAFYVEAGKSILFRNYDLGNYKTGDQVSFWSSEHLHINNKKALRTWLPFSVVSSPNVVLHYTTESGPIAWENLCEQAKLPSDVVEFIQAKGIRRYSIKVGTVRQ